MTTPPEIRWLSRLLTVLVILAIPVLLWLWLMTATHGFLP